MSDTQKILIINASARKNRSITRSLTRLFENTINSCTNTQICHRDVGMHPPSFINEAWIAAAFTDPQNLSEEQTEMLTESNILIDEVRQADIIVLGVPMYNYSMPASLKAWFDLIARVGVTFSFDLSRGDTPIEPILQGKQLVILSSRGEFDFAAGGIRAHLNGLDPSLQACSHYLGAQKESVQTVVVEYEEFKDARWEASMDAAHTQTINLATKLACGTG